MEVINMLDRINALMESEDTQKLLTENEQLLTEAVGETVQFSNTLKAFVIKHPDEFLGESTQETYKNIRLFSEVATSQFLTEVTHVYGSQIPVPVQEGDALNDYL